MPPTNITRRSLMAAIAAAPGLARAQPAVPPPLRFVVGTGLAGGVYYPLGIAVAKILSRDLPGTFATMQATDGGVSNIEMLADGRAGMGFSQVDSAMTAFEGDERFKGKPVAVRALAVLYPNRMQVVTTRGTNIRTLTDLGGKRVSTGAPGSATENMAFRLLMAAGLDRNKDFRSRERLSLLDSNIALKDGKIDAYFFCSGIPNGAIRDLGANPGVELALVDHADLAERVVARHGPVYFPDTIPADTYPGQHTENKQVSVANVLLVMDTMPSAQATAILGALWAARADLVQAHVEARNFVLDGQRSAAAGIPWHPAAAAFWEAQGVQLG